MVENKTEETVKRLRAALNLTQGQFAVKLGVAVSTVNHWANSNGEPSPLTRIRIEELWQTIDAGKTDGGKG